jgi:hypothetical protein
MTLDDFRRIALSLEGAAEGSHMGQPDFRVGGRIFATLASASQGYGNVKLTPEQQAALVEEMPEVFVPIPGGWGRMGMTHVRLDAASANQGCSQEVPEQAMRDYPLDGTGDWIAARSLTSGPDQFADNC